MCPVVHQHHPGTFAVPQAEAAREGGHCVTVQEAWQ